MAKVLEMTFSTELGKNHKLRVYEAKEDLTPEQVAAAMDAIVAKNIFSGNGGEFTGKVSARVVTTSIDDINLV